MPTPKLYSKGKVIRKGITPEREPGLLSEEDSVQGILFICYSLVLIPPIWTCSKEGEGEEHVA